MNNKKGFIKRIIAWFNEDIECLRPIVNRLNGDDPISNNSVYSSPKNDDSVSHFKPSVDDVTTETGLVLYEGTETQFDNGFIDSSSNFWDSLSNCNSSASDINPATGLPMCGGIDVVGNPYGTDTHTTEFDSHNPHNDY